MTINAAVKELKQGEILFHEGDASDWIYYVQHGSLEAFTSSQEQRTSLGIIQTDEFVGELGVLQNTTRLASVIALEATQILKYSKNAFIKLIAQDAERSIQILYSLSVRVRNLVLLNSEIAQQIAEHNHAYTLNPLSSLLSLTARGFKSIKKFVHSRKIKYKDALPTKAEPGLYSIRKGQVLFHEGQESYYAARLMSGRLKGVKALADSQEMMGIIEANEFAGEIGLLEGAPRVLTIIAIEDSQVEVYHEDAFLKMVSSNVRNTMAIITRLSLRATQLNQKLKLQTQKHNVILNASTLTQARLLFENISNVSQLTGNMLENDLVTLKTALKQESIAVQGMMETYFHYINGRASKEEMENANAEFRNFLKTLGLGALIVIPGSFITIPLVVKMSKALGINILPKSRSTD